MSAFQGSARSADLLLFRCRHQRYSRPRGRGHRDPLVVAMREPAFEIRLETESSRADVPRAIRLLSSHQVIHSAPVRRAVDRSWIRCSQSR